MFEIYWWVDTATMGKTMKVSQNIKTIEPPYDLAIPLLNIYPEEMKTGYQRDIWTLTFMQHYSQKPRYGNNIIFHQ